MKKTTTLIALCALAAVPSGIHHFLHGDSAERVAGSDPRSALTSENVVPAAENGLGTNPLTPANLPAEAAARAMAAGPPINDKLEGGPIFLSSILERRQVQVSFETFAGIRKARKGEVELDLGLEGGPVMTSFSTVIENADGGYSVAGKIKGAPLSRVLLTVQDNVMVGDISVSPSKEFLILPGVPGAAHELRRINRSVLPVCEGECEPPIAADAAADGEGDGEGEYSEMAADTETTASNQSSVTGGGLGSTAPETTVDVMILYTQEAVTRMNSLGGVVASLNQAVADANLCYKASGISLALRLAHHEQVSYTTSKMATDLGKLQKAGDGVLDDALTLKDQYAVDVVSVWHNYLNDAAGVGYLVRSGAIAKNNAYNIVDIDYAISARSWVHEVGHNMGLNHDATNASGLGSSASAYGQRFTGAGTGTVYTTIMAYPPGQRVPYFSSPDVFFDGTATGDANANNAGAAKGAKSWLAAVRSPVSPEITQQPEDAEIEPGQIEVLSIAAVGTAPVYQWFSGIAADSLQPIEGATGPTLSVSPSTSMFYQCVVQNGGGTVYSDVVTLNVH